LLSLDEKNHLGNLRAEIELMNLGPSPRQYQVSLHLVQVIPLHNSLPLTGKTYQSPVQTVTLDARQTTIVEFNESVPLSTDEIHPYQVEAWVVPGDTPGTSKRPFQITYPELLQPDHQ
jgi:hypothetical protein